MRISPSVLVLSLLLLGAGCAKAVAEPTVLPDAPPRASEDMAGDVDVQAAKIEKSFVLNDSADCQIDISYPQFAAGTLPETASFMANHVIAHFIAESLESTTDIDTPDQLGSVADAYLSTCQNEITSEYNDLSSQGEDLFTDLKRSVNIVYNVKLNQNGLLSFGLDNSSYTGGAHPNQRLTYVNVDRGGDRLLTLGDILKAEDLKVFMQYEKTQLLADNRDNLYPENADEYDRLVSDKTQMSAAEQTTTYGNTDNFYLTPTSIVTYYNPYDIAPYAAGAIYVEIPYSAIQDYIDPAGPLKTFIGQP